MEEEELAMYEEHKERTQKKVCTVEFGFIGYPDTNDTDDEYEGPDIALNMTIPGCTIRDAIKEAKKTKYSSMKRKIEAVYEADAGFEKQKGFRVWIHEREEWQSYKESTPTANTRLSDLPGFSQGLIQMAVTYTGESPAKYEDENTNGYEDEEEEDIPEQQQEGMGQDQAKMDTEDDAKSVNSKRTYAEASESAETSGGAKEGEAECHSTDTPVSGLTRILDLSKILGPKGVFGSTNEKQGDKKRRERAEQEARETRIADLEAKIAAGGTSKERLALAKEIAERDNPKKSKRH